MEEKPLYIACLDSEKAYDSVWKAGLFYKLMNNITNQIWFISKQNYKQSIGFFKIDGIREEVEIIIDRRVKQGDVLSPQLFKYYINDLLKKVKNTGLGIRYGNTNLLIIVYCDDNQILANLKDELQKLVDMCNEFCKKWSMKYNVNKSLVMNVG
jgi:DNA-directed RNA polymerase subunit L